MAKDVSSTDAFFQQTGICLLNYYFFFLQAGLIETNGELKVFIDQNLSPSKGKKLNTK